MSCNAAHFKQASGIFLAPVKPGEIHYRPAAAGLPPGHVQSSWRQTPMMLIGFLQLPGKYLGHILHQSSSCQESEVDSASALGFANLGSVAVSSRPRRSLF